MRRVAAIALVCLVAAGCGGSTKPAAVAPTAAPTVAPTTTVPPETLITTSWTTFFNAATPPATAMTYLENGSTYQAQIAQLAKIMPKGLTVRVDGVSVTDASNATVTYELLGADGKPILPKPSSGTAVLVNGRWLVSAMTFCGLATLAGAQCNG